MRNVLVMLCSATFTILALTILSSNYKNDPIVGSWCPPGSDCVHMPIVHDSAPQKAFYDDYAPQEDRGIEYRRFLSASVKIRVSGGSGSGTICFYDPQTNYAYVISCGHLWSGSRSAAELQSKPVSAKVVSWYKNEVKLDSPKEYDAQVLFWSNSRGYDCSLLRFQPDWQPEFFPIAPQDYPISPGSLFHSCGCDGGREVARYEVEFVEYRGNDLVTKRNSPRPGRSGGGLMTNDGFYIAICWGTSDTSSGGGIGYFTPLKSIHKVFQENNAGWLLTISNSRLAQTLPIRDHLNPNMQFPRDFVPIPNR